MTMTIRLEKGQRIDLEKDNGNKLTKFCVGCNWGAVVEKGFLSTKTIDVDVDLSCLLFDAEGSLVDHIYSPLYRFGDEDIPKGKLVTNDNALHHTGDDLQGDTDGDDGIDNEIITVDMDLLDPKVNSIVFFLNIYNNDDFKGDFSEIPYAYIRMFEPTVNNEGGKEVVTGVKETFAQYDVSTKTECQGMRGLVLGKLYKRNDAWRFNAIGDAFPDAFISYTIKRVIADYSH